MSRRATKRGWVLSVIFSAACCLIVLVFVVLPYERRFSPPTAPATTKWHDFQGTWTATGTRDLLKLGRERRASISTFSGSLMLAGDARPAIGFRSEAIVFNDSTTGLVGRAVWTDDKGEQVFSELRGEGTTANNKITGNFVGGTGRYAGASGDYEFSWKFLIENEDGNVQGQSVGLQGHIRSGSVETLSALQGLQK